MGMQIVRVFDEFADAERARDELLAIGFAPSAVELSVRDDEAGPVQGNFTVGDHTRDDEIVYARKFAHPTQRGCCLITVDAPDAVRAAMATEILDQLGGIAIR